MAEYGSAMSYLIIIITVLGIGLLYAMILPLIETLIDIGVANSPGTDPVTMAVIDNFVHIIFPIVIIISAATYGYRRSGQNRSY
jgi:hypothetical protein